MQSLRSAVAAPAAAAVDITKAATSYAQTMPVPSISECGRILTDGASTAAKTAAQAAKEHPYAAAAVGSGLLVASAPGLLAAPALAVAGFGSGGIVKASAAATVHGTIGNVGAGSLFATLTSAGMGGYGVAAVNAVVSGAGGAVAAAGGVGAAVSRWWK